MFCSLLTLPLSLISLLGSGTLAVPQPQFGGRHGGNQGVQTVYTTIYGPAEYAVQSPAPSVPSTTTALTARTTPPGSGAPSSTPNPSGGRGDTGSGKKGLAYNSSSPDMDIFNSATGITWGVNWGSQRAGLPKKYEFVPQLWSPEKLGSWDSDVAGASNLLSFNEPDIGSQANMPVPSAVSAHIQYMNPKANGGSVKIGSPSVSNGVAAPNAPPMGLDYLSQFLDQCEKATPEPCVVDFVSIHWYGCDPSKQTCGGVDGDLSAFKEQMTKAVSTANGLPVWITEFQHLGSEKDQQTFLSKAMTWLEDPAQAGIARYAYFMVLDGIMTNGGQLNSVGNAYAS